MHLRLITSARERPLPAPGPPARRQGPKLTLVGSPDNQSMANQIALLRRRRDALLMLLALSALSWLLIGAAIYSAIRLTD